jgi:hypothetical protein
MIEIVQRYEALNYSIFFIHSMFSRILVDPDFCLEVKIEVERNVVVYSKAHTVRSFLPRPLR